MGNPTDLFGIHIYIYTYKKQCFYFKQISHGGGTVVGVRKGYRLNIQAMVVCVLKVLIFTPSWRILPQYCYGKKTFMQQCQAPKIVGYLPAGLLDF